VGADLPAARSRGELDGGTIVEPIIDTIETPEVAPPAAARKRTPKPIVADEVE